MESIGNSINVAVRRASNPPLFVAFLLFAGCTSRTSSFMNEFPDVVTPPVDAVGADASVDATMDVPSTDTAGNDGSDATDANADTGPTGPACVILPASEPFLNPTLELHWRGAGLPFPTAENVCATPVVADIVPGAPDDDVIPEIAFMSFSCSAVTGVLRVISGRDPHATLWSQVGFGAPNDESAAPELRWDAHPAVGDLDGNLGNGPEIVVVTSAWGLVAYHGADGTVFWTSMPNIGVSMGAEQNPAVNIADLDGDGVPEVIFGASVVNGLTGALLWRGTENAGINNQGPLSVVADLDNDGLDEVIAGGTVYEHDGHIRFAVGDGFSAVGDILDAHGLSGRDGVPEIARVSAGYLYILDPHTGSIIWSRPLVYSGAGGGGIGGITGSGGGFAANAGGAPTIADFDGDGDAEIGVAGADHYTVFDPGCTAATPTCYGDGILWAAPTQDTSSAVTSSTVFDFNGDGTAEVVYNDEDQFMVLDGPTGHILFQNWNPSQTRTEQPIAADVDTDGHTEIVFGANICASFAGSSIPAPLQATERIPGLEIWGSSDGTWVSSRSIWNEHGYHIDNINDDGTIPAHETPNWTTHNTFRLQRSLNDPLAAPDLLGTPGPTDCSGGTAHVCVNVSDDGSAGSGPVTVGFYDADPSGGAMPIATTVTMHSIGLGAPEPACVDVPAPAISEMLWVRVNDDGSIRECNTGNDTFEIEVSCPPG